MATFDLSVIFRAVDKMSTPMNKMQGNFDTFSGKTKKLGESLRKMAGIIRVVAVPVILGLGATMVKIAMDFEEADSKFGVVFKGFTEKANGLRKSLVNMYGFSELAATEALAGFQDFLVPMGIARGTATELSGEFVKLTTDIASFNNVSNEQVVSAMKSALSGMPVSMRQFGVDVSMTTLKNMALARGMELVNGQLTQQQRAFLVLEKVQLDSADALGDFQRTQGSLANQLKIMKSGLSDLTKSFGNLLLPQITKVISATNSLIKANKNLFSPSARESVEKQAIAVKTLMMELAEEETTEKRRLEIMQKLNTEYKDIIKNIDLEKIATGGLSDAMKEVNNQAEIRILNLQTEAIRTEIAGHKISLLREKLAEESKIREGFIKLQEAGIDISEIENKSIEDKIKWLDGLDDATNKKIIYDKKLSKINKEIHNEQAKLIKTESMMTIMNESSAEVTSGLNEMLQAIKGTNNAAPKEDTKLSSNIDSTLKNIKNENKEKNSIMVDVKVSSEEGTTAKINKVQTIGVLKKKVQTTSKYTASMFSPGVQ